ncbi:MAG TPA: hypothetical protein VGG74_18705 [Kofleriaceae bacterium]|jgi:hypothetical protein
MPRYAAIGLLAAVAGCFGPKSHDCASDGASWVCPEQLACAAPPTYCANPIEVGACDGQPNGSPCRTTDVPDGLCVDNACQQCGVDIEGCRQVGWNEMTVPSGTYNLVYAVGSGDAWAGGQTTLVHYDGAHWEVDATFPTLTGGIGVVSLGGTSTGHMFAGTNSDTVYHQVGGAWVATTTGAIGKAVWADGDDDAFVVGVGGDVERYAGSAWTPMTSMTTQTLVAVWGSSASDVYAVGTSGAVIHFNGTSWSSSTVGSGALTAVWGSGPSDVYVGGAGGIWHSTDGAMWTSQDGSDSVLALWGDASGDVFAGTKTAGILYSDGTGLWVPLVSPTMVSSIGGTGPADAFAATGTQIERYTGACWSTLPAPMTSGTLYGVSLASPSAVFAAGDSGVLDRFDGSAWASDTIGADDCLGVWARSAGDAYAVKTGLYHWDGASWSTQTLPTTGDALVAVTGNASSEYALGTHLYANTDSTWSDVATLTSYAPAAFWLGPDGTVFVAGIGLFSVSSAGAVSPVFAGDASWSAIWGSSPTDVFAAGSGGVIRHYDGTGWSDPMDTQTSVDLDGLWGNGSDDVFAVGDNGTLLHYHAQLWSSIEPPGALTMKLSSVSGSGSTIFFVGDDGTVLRLIESAP